MRPLLSFRWPIGVTLFAMAFLCIVIPGCGLIPEYPVTVEWPSQEYEQTMNYAKLRDKDIPGLPGAVPLYCIRFERNSATEKRLRQISQTGLTNVYAVSCTDCPGLTDKGVEYLSRIVSFRQCYFFGTSVTDAGCETIATKMRLREISLLDCPKITGKGLSALARTDTIEEIDFSLGSLTEAELLQIITACHRVQRIKIHLGRSGAQIPGAGGLKAAAKARNVKLWEVRTIRIPHYPHWEDRSSEL